MMFKTITHLVFGMTLIMGLIGCGSSKKSDDNKDNGFSEVSDSRYNQDSSSEDYNSDGDNTNSESDEESNPTASSGNSSATDESNSYSTSGTSTTSDEDSSTVADKTPPTITIKGDNPLSIVKESTYSDKGATALDSEDGAVTVTQTGSVDTSTVGTYEITYSARDKAGNRATATRTVNVTLEADREAPTITITGDNPLKITQGETFSDPGATATDNRDGTISVIPTGTVDMDVAGEYTITYTATDSSNNKTTATSTPPHLKDCYSTIIVG